MAVWAQNGSFSDTTGIAITTAATYLRGIKVWLEIDETAADAWLDAWNAAIGSAVPGTNVPHLRLPLPMASGIDNKFVYHFRFPMLEFGTGLVVFVSDTAPYDVSASTELDRIEVYYDLAGVTSNYGG